MDGSSIAFIMASALRNSKSLPYFYVNVRENSTSIKIYRNITHLFGKGYEVQEVKKRCDEILTIRSLIVLYEVDF
jgi:cell division control protein 6